MAEWAGVRAVTLGVVGGYVDSVGYLMLRGLFPNHVTGNLPLAAADPGWTAVPALLMVPLWLAAVVAAARIGRRDGIVTLLAVEAGLLGLFLAAGAALVPHPAASTLVTRRSSPAPACAPWPPRAWSAGSGATPTRRQW